MYNIVNMCLEVITAFLQGYCLQYFMGNFLEVKFNSRFTKGNLGDWLVTFVYGVLRLSIILLMPSDYGSVRTILKLVLTFLVLLIISLCFYKAFHTITIFLIITFMAVSEISGYLVHIIALIGDRMTILWNWCMEQGYIPSIKIYETISILLTQIIVYAAFLMVLYLSLKQIVRSFGEKDYHFQRKELLFILLPSLAGLLICTLLRSIMFTVEDNIPELLYNKYPHLNFLIPTILILSLLSILYVVKLFQDMIYLNREKSSRIILEKQIKGMQEHLEEMEHVYAGIRGMKHDMKNTLAVIMQLARENGKTENKESTENTELQAYLSEVNQSFDRLELQFNTGNTVVDSLLNMKYHEIIRTIPDVQVNAERLFFPQSLHIQNYDIGVIVGNALDNAIEACKKLKAEQQSTPPFIRMFSFQKGEMFFIEVENSFNGKIIQRKQSEFPLTDKKERKSHGMGLLNIKNTVEKYQGGVDWSIKNKIFTLSVMMKSERSKDYEY